MDDTASALRRSLADQEATRRIREEQAPLSIRLACGFALFVHGPIPPAFNPALLLSSDSCSDLGQSCAFIWQRAAAAAAAAGSSLSAAQPSQSASWMTGHSASTRVRYVPREHSYGHFVRVQFAAQQRPDRNGPVWQEVGMPPTPCTRTHPHKAHMALTSRLIHSHAWSGRSAGDAIRYARDTPLTRTCRAAAVRTNTS